MSSGPTLDDESIHERDFAHRRQRVRRTGGFLLQQPSPPSSHSQSSPQPPHGGGLRIDKTRDRPAMDPTQLVHMALNLSESRRRNASNTSRTSTPAQRKGSTSGSASHTNTGGSSLSHYLGEQRRISRNMSPRAPNHTGPRRMSMSLSSATLARRDRARAYLELRAEYMRLLDYLPPLKQDANAPGNHFFSATNVPGSPHAALTRTSSYANNQHPLGRLYNPLQAIRNRRIRARERHPLPHAPEAFADPDHVSDWVDRVEQRAAGPGYRFADRVALPDLLSDHDPNPDVPLNKPTNPHIGWGCTPEELLADACWLEQGDNKTIIEDRHGHKLFPSREQQKHEPFPPRLSKEIAIDHTTGDESEHGSERGRRRRLLPAIRGESRLRKAKSPRKHSVDSSDSSDSSDSDTDAARSRRSVDVQNNTGPLALQMKNLLEQQAKVGHIDTPDTPDKWGRSHGNVRSESTVRQSLEVPRFTNGHVEGYGHERKVSKTPNPQPRSNLMSPSTTDEPRSSFEDLDSSHSTAPNTPLHTRHFPHIGSDFSPPPSRAGSDLGKSKRSKLGIFHSNQDPSKHEKHGQKQNTTHDKHDRHDKYDKHEKHDKHDKHKHDDSTGAVKNLLGHRKNDSVSSLPSPDKLRRRETHESREPHSAVTRFFKGVKHEGSKVGEKIFRRDRQDDSDADTAPDRSSMDLDVDDYHPPTITRTATHSTADSITSKSGRYHLELPSFRPAHEFTDEDNDSSLEHHVSRQARERRHSRSPRFDRLAPPRMDLDRMSRASSTTSIVPVRSHGQEHMSKVLAKPGGVFHGDLPPTALKSRSDGRRPSRPKLDDKRQWSITNSHSERRKADVPSQADIARVRALFLCSGVKAKELSRRAATPSTHPPPFLRAAAATADTPLISVPKKEEHVLAARLLLRNLEASTAALDTATSRFRSTTAHALAQQIDDLRRAVDDDLMPRVFAAGDAAVRITSDVSGQGPLQVKQVSDEIERLLRARRRRMVWLGSVGWNMLEWALVGVMWWVWLVVVLVGAVRRVLGAGVGVVRWLVWL
jgi:hypothetical protein